MPGQNHATSAYFVCVAPLKRSTLSLSGCSEAALECGRVMGISGHPKTIRRFIQELAGDNAKHVDSYIQTARSKHKLVLLIVDDFHVVHTIQRPTSAETSTAIHMATCVIDVHETIPCLPKQSSPHYWPSDLQSKELSTWKSLGSFLPVFTTLLSPNVAELPSFRFSLS